MEIDFLNWIHNNFYTPTGTDLYWRIETENIECGIVPEGANIFSAEQLFEKFKNGEGYFI